MLIEYEHDRARYGPVLAAEEAAISVVTLSEFLHGAHRAPERQRQQRLARVEHLLSRFAALPITESVARTHARVWAELEASGSTIGAHDLWIAATALTHDLGVATLDSSFARVPGLRVVTP